MLDPLDGLAALDRDALTAVRMFWSRPAESFAVAGIGAAVSFTAGGAARFSTTDAAWRELLDDAIVDGPRGSAPGAGPMLMGGFAFDDDGPHTDRWRGFPAALLFVPRVQVVRAGGRCWLTMNLLVAPDATPEVAQLLELRDRVLAAGPAAPAAEGRGDEALAWSELPGPDEWRALVARAVAAIRSGALEKVVVAREVRVTASHDVGIIVALQHLRSAHEGSYVFGIWRGDAAFIGASPERLVRVEGGGVRASTLAGSIRRGATAEEDDDLAARLLASAKDREEHEVVRRALCSALEALCDDVVSEDGPSLLTLPQVHHLHTAVRARLRPGHTVIELIERLHPTPAVGGAPREAALRFLHDHEQLDRGWYAAPVGWLQRDGGEFAVALRSALLRGAGASLYAGCGIVADSDPDREYAESRLKLVPMQLALAAAMAGHGPAAGAGTADAGDQ